MGTEDFIQKLIVADLATADSLRSIGSGLSLEEMYNRLVAKAIIDEEALAFQFAKYMDMKYMRLADVEIEHDAVEMASFSLAEQAIIMPVRFERDALVVAFYNIAAPYKLEDISIELNKKIEPVVASLTEIRNAQLRYYSDARTQAVVSRFEQDTVQRRRGNESGTALHINPQHGNRNNKETSHNQSKNESPQSQFVDIIVRQAVGVHASDIHIEPYEGLTRIRMRIDGDLREIRTINSALHRELVGRIKILCNLDTAESRLPHDGHFRQMAADEQEVDLRVSIVPTIFGEKVVMRIIYRSGFIFGKNELGFLPHDIIKIDHLLKNSNGVIIVSGPTGSGKTTTLSSFVREIKRDEINIISLENPVEQIIEDITQIEINSKIGLTFANSLRAILRQDPDVIVIGEMRDTETADIALRSAMTGHLVLTSLHTNSAISSVMRLFDLGVEPYIISATLRGVIYQRLMKRICIHCKTELKPTKSVADLLGITEDQSVYIGVGCSKCHQTGYTGRLCCSEILIIDEKLQHMIIKRQPLAAIEKHAREQGFIRIQESAARHVIDGVTTTDEFLRLFSLV